jgi:peptide/nickel transport system permease protein
MKLLWLSYVDRGLLRKLFRAAGTICLAFLFSAALLRFAPGWSADERDMDPRLSAETVQILRAERAGKRGLLRFYGDFLNGVTQGSPARSELFERPLSEIIAERAALTTKMVGLGLFTGWLLAVLTAGATSRDRRGVAVAGAASVSGLLLSVPSALVALACLVLDLPIATAIAAVVFPRIFPHAHDRFQQQFRAPHVIMARARGISGWKLLRWHVVPGVLPALAALAGASVPLAFGAAIPIESLSDSPGLGQLAWQAALGRDMPLLVAVTLLLTTISVTANLLTDRRR